MDSTEKRAIGILNDTRLRQVTINLPQSCIDYWSEGLGPGETVEERLKIFLKNWTIRKIITE